MPNSNNFETKEEYNAWMREYRAKNRDKIRKYYREYNHDYRQKYGYYNEKNSKKRYPEKEKARRILQRAVKVGFIKKLSCKVCGDKRSEAHHTDYTKPLEVIWYCKIHHTEIHRPYKK